MTNFFDSIPIDKTKPKTTGNYFDSIKANTGNQIAPLPELPKAPALPSSTVPPLIDPARIHSATQSAINLATGASPVKTYAQSAFSALPRVSFGGTMFEGVEAKKILDSIILPNSLATSANNLLHAPSTIAKDILGGTYEYAKQALGNIKQDPFLPVALAAGMAYGGKESARVLDPLKGYDIGDISKGFGEGKPNTPPPPVTPETAVGPTETIDAFNKGLDATLNNTPEAPKTTVTNPENQKMVDGLLQEASTRKGGGKIGYLRAAKVVSNWKEKYDAADLKTLAKNKSGSTRQYVQKIIDTEKDKLANAQLSSLTPEEFQQLTTSIPDMQKITKEQLQQKLAKIVAKREAPAEKSPPDAIDILVDKIKKGTPLTDAEINTTPVKGEYNLPQVQGELTVAPSGEPLNVPVPGNVDVVPTQIPTETPETPTPSPATSTLPPPQVTPLTEIDNPAPEKLPQEFNQVIEARNTGLQVDSRRFSSITSASKATSTRAKNAQVIKIGTKYAVGVNPKIPTFPTIEDAKKSFEIGSKIPEKQAKREVLGDALGRDVLSAVKIGKDYYRSSKIFPIEHTSEIPLPDGLEPSADAEPTSAELQQEERGIAHLISAPIAKAKPISQALLEVHEKWQKRYVKKINAGITSKVKPIDVPPDITPYKKGFEQFSSMKEAEEFKKKTGDSRQLLQDNLTGNVYFEPVLDDLEGFKDASSDSVDWQEVALMDKQIEEDGEAYDEPKSLIDLFNNEEGGITIRHRSTVSIEERQKLLDQINAGSKMQRMAKQVGVPLAELGKMLGMSDAGIAGMEALVRDIPKYRKQVQVGMRKEMRGLSPTQRSVAVDNLAHGLGILTKSSKVAINALVEHLEKTKRIVPDYAPGSGEIPERQIPGIDSTTPIARKELFTTLRVPHNIFHSVFGTEFNPVQDMEESLNAYVRNSLNMQKWSKDLLKDVDTGDALIKKTLIPIYRKYGKTMQGRINIMKQIHNLEFRIEQTPVSNTPILERLDRDLAKLKTRRDELENKLQPLTKEYDAHIVALAKAKDGIRIILDAGDMLPEGITLSPEEQAISDKVKEYFLQTRNKLEELGIPVIKSKSYVPHIFSEFAKDKQRFSFTAQDTQVPGMLKFMHQLPGSRIWIPSPKEIFKQYIPNVERKIAYQPFLDKWQPFSQSNDYPKLQKYMQRWIFENLFRDPPSWGEKAANFYIGMEYVRLVGLSMRVVKKHIFKVLGTLARYDAKTDVKATIATQKIPLQYAMEKLGVKGKSQELKLMRAFVNSREITKVLDETPLLNSWSRINAHFKFLMGGPVSLTELLDNGVSILAGAIKGGRTGVSFEDTRKGIWQTVLDVNQRSGPDQYLWQKHVGVRLGTMFIATPLKIAENQIEMLVRACKGERDVFGGHYGSMLLRYLLLIGLAESGARSLGTSIQDSVLEEPGYNKRTGGPSLTPPVELFYQWAKSGFVKGTEKHFNYFGAYTQYQKIQNSMYNKVKYRSDFDYIFGLVNNKYQEPERGEGSGSGNADLTKLNY